MPDPDSSSACLAALKKTVIVAGLNENLTVSDRAVKDKSILHLAWMKGAIMKASNKC